MDSDVREKVTKSHLDHVVHVAGNARGHSAVFANLAIVGSVAENKQFFAPRTSPMTRPEAMTYGK